ncbi:hypothetical protein [Hymenobacter sp. UYP22]|uniref:hypothetical protein n=1 Tax=Hymenobacter sp. UYP22 TaxID=3156348 RepID=UPI0033966A45
MATLLGQWLRRATAYTGLIVLATVSFLFSPAPLTEDEYCGTYLHLTSFAGFTANCDGFVYMEDARYPAHLLEQGEVRQSRPLFILLGTVVGYPLTWTVQGLQSSGLLPASVVQKLPVKYQPLLGFYVGYVLLNYAVLLAALLLFRHLYYRLTGRHGSRWVLAALLVFLVSNQVTKAFFWTVHQQMFTFLVPLLLAYTGLQLRESGRWRAWLPGLAVLGGLLALVYGSFVLGLPVLLYGAWLQQNKNFTAGFFLQLAGLSFLFALPTLGWVGLLKLHGVTYYNHEAQSYGQLVWLRAAWQQPFTGFLQLAGRNLLRFLVTVPAIAPFLGLAAAVVLWPQKTRLLHRPLTPIGGLLLLQTGFLAGLGYYKERLTFALLPLLLLIIAVQLIQYPGRQTGAWLLAAALGWHAWQVLRYGPFS